MSSRDDFHKPNGVSSPSAAPNPLSKRRKSQLEETIERPGAISINVEGAFIIDDPAAGGVRRDAENGAFHDTGDIRLPHHTALVSHVAIDASLPPRSWGVKELTCLDEDWRDVGQAGLFLSRGKFTGSRWAAQLSEV